MKTTTVTDTTMFSNKVDNDKDERKIKKLR